VARAALIAVALAARSASASPPLSLAFDTGDGVGWAHRAGAYRDDEMTTLRFGVGIGDYATFDTGVSYDVEHLEAALRFGSRIRTHASPCWSYFGQLYLHGEIAIVNASHLASNLDFLAGVGHWGHITSYAPWLAWYVEVNTVARVGDYDALSARVDVGLAVQTSSFWR